MPIIITDASKLVVGPQPKPRLSSVQPVSETLPSSGSQRYEPNSKTVYVNGKEHKLNKSSQYVVDMLTLNE